MVSALEDGRLALDHAERSGERRLILDVAARLSLWELWAGRDPTELLARAVALEEPDDDLRGYQSPRMPLALQRMYQGRLGEARTIFEALLAEAVALGDEIAALAVRGRLVDVALRAGEWAQADGACRRRVRARRADRARARRRPHRLLEGARRGTAGTRRRGAVARRARRAARRPKRTRRTHA